MRTAFMVLSILLGAIPPATIRVSPQVLMGGQTVYVTCRVSPDSRNRELRAGITGYTESGRQLDGKDAPITSIHRFDYIPCDAESAYCAVLRNDGSLNIVKANLLVSCS